MKGDVLDVGVKMSRMDILVRLRMLPAGTKIKVANGDVLERYRSQPIGREWHDKIGRMFGHEDLMYLTPLKIMEQPE